MDADFNCCRSAPQRHSTDIQISFYCVVSVLPIAQNTFSEEQPPPPPTVTREAADPTGIWKRKNQLGSPGGQDVITHTATHTARVWKQAEY